MQESPDKIKRNEELDNTEYEQEKLLIKMEKMKWKMKNLSPETNKKKKRE